MCAGDLQESGGHSGGTPRCLRQPCASQREPSLPAGLRVCHNTFMSASTVCVCACVGDWVDVVCVCVGGVGNVCKGSCVVGRMSNGPTFCMDSQHETQCNTNHVIPS